MTKEDGDLFFWAFFFSGPSFCLKGSKMVDSPKCKRKETKKEKQKKREEEKKELEKAKKERERDISSNKRRV